MELDWGGKLRVNHIHECMPCESDWGAHETHQNEHSTTRVHWGDHDLCLNPMDKYGISEVDWGAHDSSYFLYLVHIDPDASQKISSPKSVGRTTTKDIFQPSHRLESCGKEVGTSSGTSEGSKPSGSPVAPTVGPHTKSGPPTIFISSRSVSKSMPEFDHYSLVGRTFLLPPEENGEILNFHLPHGISEIFF